MPQIELKNVRLQSFGGQIWNPKAFDGQDPAYTAHAIFPADHIDRVLKIKTVDMIEKAMEQAAIAKFGTKADAMFKAAKLAQKIPMHSGDMRPQSDGYPGNMFLSSRLDAEKPAPTVIDRQGNPTKQADGIVYDGCMVDLIVDIFGYDRGSNGIGAALRGVRFCGPGDAFGFGAPVQASAFSQVEDDGSDDIAL